MGRAPLRSDLPWVADEAFRLYSEGKGVDEIGDRFGVERIMASNLVQADRERNRHVVDLFRVDPCL